METLEAFNSINLYENGRKYHLSFLVDPFSVSFAILDIESKKYIGFKKIFFEKTDDFISEVGRIINSEPILQNKFESSAIQYQSFRAMLVPESLFDSRNLKSFLKFHHEVDDKDHIHFFNLKAAEAFVIYSLPANLQDVFVSKYPEIKFSHNSIPFIYNALELRDKNETAPCLHIHFAKDFFDVLIVRNGKIQLFNSFFYKKYTDVIYFVVNILNLFSLKPDHSKVFISGDVDDGSELEKELEKIFKPIQFEKYNMDYSYIQEMLDLKQHKYINLLNNFNCV